MMGRGTGKEEGGTGCKGWGNQLAWEKRHSAVPKPCQAQQENEFECE